MPSTSDVKIIIRAQNATGRAFKAVRGGLTKMAKVGKQTSKMLRKGFEAVKKTIRAVGKAFTTALKLMIIPLAALGLGFVAAIKQAASFQQSMANVRSVLGSNAETMKRVSNAAREMGKKSVFSAQEAAKAMYDLASAGFSADQVIKALEGTMLLAAATASDLTFTTETVTSTIKQFSLEAGDADRVANAFAATISFSKMNMDRLAVSMSFAGPVAAAFGHTMEGTLSVLAQFANLGLRASMIGTTFRQGLLALQKAMPAEQIERGADVLKRLGIQFKDIDPAAHSVADIVETLHGKVTKMSEAVALFGVRAGGPFLKLIQAGAAPLREFEKKITGTRKAFEMSAIQIATFYGSLRLLKSAIQEAQISLGTAFLPVLVKIVDTFTKWVTIINQIDWTEWWSGFKTQTGVAVDQLNAVLDLFRAGGSFRNAITEWAWFFVDAISAVSKVIWIPLETELVLMATKMATKLKEIIGPILAKMPFTGDIGGRMMAEAEQARLFGGGREQAFRESQAKRQAEASKAMMKVSPKRAVGATGEFFGEFAGALQAPAQMADSGKKTAKAAEEEQKQQQIFRAEVIDAQGKMHTIFSTSVSSLQNDIKALRAKIGEIEVKSKKALTSGQTEIGAIS